MASVPGGDDATSTVRDFYTRHAAAVLTVVPVLWLTVRPMSFVALVVVDSTLVLLGRSPLRR